MRILLSTDPWLECGQRVPCDQMNDYSLKDDGFVVFNCGKEWCDFNVLPIDFLRTNLYDLVCRGMLNQSRHFWRPLFNKFKEDNQLKDDSDRITNRWYSVMDTDFQNESLKKKVNVCIIVLLYLYSS